MEIQDNKPRSPGRMCRNYDATCVNPVWCDSNTCGIRILDEAYQAPTETINRIKIDKNLIEPEAD